MLGFPFSGELLGEERGILGGDPARGLENRVRATTVAVEHKGPLDPEILAEPNQYPRVRAGPREDGLLVIADREDVAMWCRDPLQDFVLCRVEILEFVHELVIPPCSDGVRDVFPLAEQRKGLADEVVEVERIPSRELRGVVSVERLVSCG